jgi:hypothetical protein
MAGCALLAFLPLLGVGTTMGWLNRSSQVRAASISNECAAASGHLAAQDRLDRTGSADSTFADPLGIPSVVVLSIEPAVVAPGSEVDVPVVLPGYVLPDDSLEDSSHAGS